MTNTTSIPMTHLSIVATLMDFLAEIGGPVESGLATAGMPTRIIDHRRGYVPCRLHLEGEVRWHGGV